MPLRPSDVPFGITPPRAGDPVSPDDARRALRSRVRPANPYAGSGPVVISREETWPEGVTVEEVDLRPVKLTR